MAASSLLKTKVDEITTCSICFGDFVSPRTLHCQHSFCFKCLQGHFKDKLPGDTAQCPRCGMEFMFPQNGLEGFMVNFVLQNLIDTKRASCAKPRPGPCEVCSTDQQFVRATVFCVDCSQRLCERCSLLREKTKGGAHDVRPLDDERRPAVEKDIQKLNIRGKHKFVLLTYDAMMHTVSALSIRIIVSYVTYNFVF